MKKAITLIIIAIVLALAVFIGYSQRGHILSFFYGLQSDAANDGGRPERAALALERELTHSPGNLKLRYQVIDAFLAIGNYARAEYHLVHGISEHPGEFEIYRRLSALYVEQDKLLDAVSLLDGISNPRVLQTLDERRPSPPVPNHKPGEYSELISLTFESPATCYISKDGGIPSIETNMYAEPIVLSSGQTELTGAAVNEEGLISEWWTGAYTLSHIKEQVVFEDAQMESLLRAAIKQPEGPVSSDMLWDVTELTSEAPASYVTLNDLKWLTSLEKLSLSGSDGDCDISVLPELTELKSLTLVNLHIDMLGLETISQCSALENLNVSVNRIASLSPISALTNLTSLDLHENSIIDVSPLSSLTALTYLDLSQNTVENISPLAPLVKLNTLLLNDNRISGLYGLQGMSALTKLNLSKNALKTLNIDSNSETGTPGMGGLSALTHLYASSNQIESLSPLGSLAKIEVLDVSLNAVNGLDGIQKMTVMRELDASNNQIASLSGIEPCVSLVTLNMNRNQIDALSPLIGLPSLKTLNVEYNKLTTLKAVLDFPAIQLVNAFGNSVTDPIGMFVGKGYTVNRG